MREVSRTGGIIHSVRTAAGGLGADVPVAWQRPLHVLPQRRAGRCIRYRAAKRAVAMTASLTLAACNVARYSES